MEKQNAEELYDVVVDRPEQSGTLVALPSVPLAQAKEYMAAHPGHVIQPTINEHYQTGLAHVLTGRPCDLRNRTPHPPVIAKGCARGGDTIRPTLPPGDRQQDRVVPWSGYMVGIIHGGDGNTYAFTGDSISVDNVGTLYLLAEAMHV